MCMVPPSCSFTQKDAGYCRNSYARRRAARSGARCDNSKCSCAHLFAPGRAGRVEVCPCALIMDWYLKAAEKTTDQRKAGLKSKAQCVSCYLKDALDAPTQRPHTDFMIGEAASSYFKHFHECSHASVTHILALSSAKLKAGVINSPKETSLEFKIIHYVYQLFLARKCAC